MVFVAVLLFLIFLVSTTKKAAKVSEIKSDAVDFMNWTLSGDCQYQCVDEDEWNGPDYMETRQTYTTEEVYQFFKQIK